MSLVSTLARLEAMEMSRAIPLTAFRHRHLSDHPLVIVPLTMAGEAGAPMAAMVGTSRTRSAMLVVAQPRNRDQRFAFAAELGQIVMDYIDSCRVHRRDIARGRSEMSSVYTDAPQLLVPNDGGIKALADLGRMCRFRSTSGPYPVSSVVPQLGVWLTFLADQAEQAGTALLLPITDLLSEHWATGQSRLENQNLSSLMAWIDPSPGLTVAEAVRDAENPALCPPAGPATDPGFDIILERAIKAHSKAREAGDELALAQAEAHLRDALASQLEPTWRTMWRAISLLRAVPEAPRTGSRFERDRSEFTKFSDYLDAGGLPQPKRDSPITAARRLSHLERALANFESELAFDDPYVLADRRSIGEAFAGQVVEARPDWVVTTEKGSRVPRPRITVRTEDPVRLAEETWLTSPTMPPGHKAVIAAVQPDGDASLVLLQVVGGMGRTRIPRLGTVPALGQHIVYLPDPRWRPTPQFPDSDHTPWTHGGVPTTPGAGSDAAAEEWGDP